MMKYLNNTIYVDIDGVVLFWLRGFYSWTFEVYGLGMKTDQNTWDLHEVLEVSKETGDQLIREFNESWEASHLHPYLDSVKYIKKMHEEHGYVFEAITSSHCPAEDRMRNLQKYFGNAFSKVHVVGHNKTEKLLEIRDKEQTAFRHFIYDEDPVYWIEDNIVNCGVGKRIGFNSILLSHPYNTQATEDDYDIKLSNWKEIYSTICD